MRWSRATSVAASDSSRRSIPTRATPITLTAALADQVGDEGAAHDHRRPATDADADDVRATRTTSSSLAGCGRTAHSPCITVPTTPPTSTFAWNHGGIQPEIATTWLGMVGPGVRNTATTSTWADHTDIQPTMLALVGLKNTYVPRRTRPITEFDAGSRCRRRCAHSARLCGGSGSSTSRSTRRSAPSVTSSPPRRRRSPAGPRPTTAPTRRLERDRVADRPARRAGGADSRRAQHAAFGEPPRARAADQGPDLQGNALLDAACWRGELAVART